MDPQLQFTLDVGHALQSNMDMIGLLQELPGVFPEIHLHDVSQTGNSHKVLGSGFLNSMHLGQILSRTPDSTLVTLEMLTMEDNAVSLNYLADLK